MEKGKRNMEVTFESLGLSEAMLKALEEKGYGYPTTIQAEAIPYFLQWRDVIAKAPTGTGKTFAFGIPMVEHADPQGTQVTGLVLAPTRELANQINDVLMPLAQMYGMTTTTVYGGVRYARQIRDLRAGADIVVACPGRLEDLLEQHALTLEKVEVAVIDEADEMADMGFLPPVKRLLGQVSFDAQIMLFSATLDHGVDEVVNRS